MNQYKSIVDIRLFTVDSGQRGEDDCSNKFIAAIRLVTLCHGEKMVVDPGEYCDCALLLLVVVGWAVEVVHGSLVADLDPRLDASSTVVRV